MLNFKSGRINIVSGGECVSVNVCVLFVHVCFVIQLSFRANCVVSSCVEGNLICFGLKFNEGHSGWKTYQTAAINVHLALINWSIPLNGTGVDFRSNNSSINSMIPPAIEDLVLLLFVICHLEELGICWR